VSTDDDVIGTPEERDAIEAALNAGRDGEAERLLIEMLDRDDEMRDRPTRRAEACAAFFDLVTEFGSAKINCDMESYGREPGDIVTILVAAPLGGYYSSYEIEFTAEAIQEFRERIEPLYEADAALLTGKAPASSGGSPQRGEGGEG
jgi:hypothetical protein